MQLRQKQSLKLLQKQPHFQAAHNALSLSLSEASFDVEQRSADFRRKKGKKGKKSKRLEQPQHDNRAIESTLNALKPNPNFQLPEVKFVDLDNTILFVFPGDEDPFVIFEQQLPLQYSWGQGKVLLAIVESLNPVLNYLFVFKDWSQANKFEDYRNDHPGLNLSVLSSKDCCSVLPPMPNPKSDCLMVYHYGFLEATLNYMRKHGINKIAGLLVKPSEKPTNQIPKPKNKMQVENLQMYNPSVDYEDYIDVSETKLASFVFDGLGNQGIVNIDNEFFGNFRQLHSLYLNGVTSGDSVRIPLTVRHFKIPYVYGDLDLLLNIAKTAENLEILEIVDNDEPWSAFHFPSCVYYKKSPLNGGHGIDFSYLNWVKDKVDAAEFPCLQILIIAGYVYVREGEHFSEYPINMYPYAAPSTI